MRVVLVLGGNGFIGRQICREAVRRGAQVYSLSRSGPPAPSFLRDAALSRVVWLSGDASNLEHFPANIRPDVIVHCIGTLLEGAKGVRYKEGSFSTALAMLTYATGAKSSADSTKSRAGVKVGYVSADDFSGLGRWALPGYFEWKYKAEAAIEKRFREGDLRGAVVVRPGIVTGWERIVSVIIGWIYSVIAFVSAGLLPPTRSAAQVANGLFNALEANDQFARVTVRELG